MRNHSGWEDHELHVLPDATDVFDIPNEPLLGLAPNVEPGSRGSIRALEGDQIGPVNMPTFVAYPGHPAFDSFGGPYHYWSTEAGVWRICP